MIPVLTEVRHFRAGCDPYASVHEALAIARISNCDVVLDIGISGYGTITMAISASNTIEQLDARLEAAKDGAAAILYKTRACPKCGNEMSEMKFSGPAPNSVWACRDRDCTNSQWQNFVFDAEQLPPLES